MQKNRYFLDITFKKLVMNFKTFSIAILGGGGGFLEEIIHIETITLSL